MPNMTPQQIEKYYTNLLGPTEAETLAGTTSAGKVGRVGSLKNLAKGAVPGLLGWMLLEQILSARNAAKDRGLQMEAMGSQAAMQTPENLYYQAALPQAQQEEGMARNALLTHLSGGVIGPTLARGERMIGG